MPLSERDAARLWDMLSAAREARSYIEGMTFEQYLQDKKTQRSVERAMEILGEAANSVSEEVQEANPDIDWSGMIGFRNVLIHQYGKVQQDGVWEIVNTTLPKAITELEEIMPDPESY